MSAIKKLFTQLCREPYDYKVEQNSKGSGLRIAYYSLLLCMAVWLLVKISSSVPGILLTFVFIASLVMAERLKVNAMWKYFFSIMSFFLLLSCLLLYRLDFFYMTRFVFFIPILYAFLLHEPFSANIAAIGFVLLFHTYQREIPQEILGSYSYTILCTSISQTGICYLIDKLNQERNKYREASITDALTGLKTLDHVIKTGQELLDQGRNLSVLIIDMDHFKKINDTYGHIQGNNVLVQTAELLKTQFQTSDCTLGRLGGDEFILLLQDRLDTHFLQELSYRLCTHDFTLESSDSALRIGFSVGMAQAQPGKNETILELMQRADAQMYQDKRLRHDALVG